MKLKLPFGSGSKKAKTVPKAQFQNEPAHMSLGEQQRIRSQMEGELTGSRDARDAAARDAAAEK